MSKISSGRGGGSPIEVGSSRYKKLMKKAKDNKVEHKRHDNHRDRVQTTASQSAYLKDRFEVAPTALPTDWATFNGT